MRREAAVDGDLGAGDGRRPVGQQDDHQRSDLPTVPVRPSGVSRMFVSRKAGEAEAVISVSMQPGWIVRRLPAHPGGPRAAASGDLPADLRRPGGAPARHAGDRAGRGALRRQLPVAAHARGADAAHRPDSGAPRPPSRPACRGPRGRAAVRGGSAAGGPWPYDGAGSRTLREPAPRASSATG